MSFLLSLASLSSHPNICYGSENFFVICADNATNSPMHAALVS